MITLRQIIAAVFLIFLVVLMVNLSIDLVKAAPINPTVDVEQPLYTRLNQEAYLKGSGFSSGTYFIWLRTPNHNSTEYTGVTFQSVADGSIPSDTNIKIGSGYPFGTYKVSISSSSNLDSSIAECHFGLWGSNKSVYQRTETVEIIGGGIWPGSSVKIIVRNSLGTFVFNSTNAANMNGTFSSIWTIPSSESTGSDDIFIDGTGTFDDSKEDYFHKTSFTVIPAILSISIFNEPQDIYQRTEIATMEFLVKYPDMSPVISIEDGVEPASIMNNEIVVEKILPVISDSVNGVWEVTWEIPKNATLGDKYRFQLVAESFDDGFRNVGGLDVIASDFFSIVPAVLSINIEVNRSVYQVAFDSIKIDSLITYPNSMILNRGDVSLEIDRGNINETVSMTYDYKKGLWSATHPLNLFELSKIGGWILRVEANDGLGNRGVSSIEVSVQPWLLLIVFAALVIIIFVLIRSLQWFRRRHWKKLLNRSRNIHIPFRRF